MFSSRKNSTSPKSGSFLCATVASFEQQQTFPHRNHHRAGKRVSPKVSQLRTIDAAFFRFKICKIEIGPAERDPRGTSTPPFSTPQQGPWELIFVLRRSHNAFFPHSTQTGENGLPLSTHFEVYVGVKGGSC